jgi:hypothetical protein
LLGDCHIAESFHAQLKRRVRESLQESAAVIGHLAHCVFDNLTKQHMNKEAAHAFAEVLEKEN